MKSAVANQGGQLIVEAVLIIVVFMGITASVVAYFKDEEVLKTLVSGPWLNLSGMLQTGSWAPPKTGALTHPNAKGRHMTFEGEDVR